MSYYLSGPMTGLPDFNRAEFERVGAILRASGYDVVDPVSEDIRVYGSWEEAIKRPWQEHLARDVAMVPHMDAMIVMDGWERSSGATLEARIARTFGLPIYRFDTIAGFPSGPAILTRVEETTLDEVLGPSIYAPTVEATEASRTTYSPDTNVYDGDHFIPYAENPLRHVFGTGGIKDNRGKAPVDLLPSAPLVAIAEVLAFGAKKYQPHNWRRGLPWPDTYASLMRHLLAWNSGEDVDPESGANHLANAGCQLMFLLDFVLSGVGAETDTRFVVCERDDCDRAGARHPTSDHRGQEENPF